LKESTVRYPAYVHPEDGAFVVTFPDCAGCQTQADTSSEVASMAEEALVGWLEAMMEVGEVPPPPRERTRPPKGARLEWVSVPATLAAKVALRQARLEAGLTQAELARRAGVSQQQVAKIERPDSNPTLATLERLAQVLGLRLHVAFAAP
jgi:antitoxin HicB